MTGFFSFQSSSARRLASPPLIGRIAGKAPRVDSAPSFGDTIVVKPRGQTNSALGAEVNGGSAQMRTPRYHFLEDIGPLLELGGITTCPA